MLHVRDKISMYDLRLTNQDMYVDDNLRMVLQMTRVSAAVILRCRRYADSGTKKIQLVSYRVRKGLNFVPHI